MKKATLLAIFLALFVTATSGQDNQNTTLTQCRDLAETGNFVGPDEVLVNGKVCKVSKTPPPKPEPPAAANQQQTLLPKPTSTAPEANASVASPSTSASSSSSALASVATPVAVPTPSPSTPPPAPPPPPASRVQPTSSPMAQPECAKNVSFGVFENGRMFVAEPNWITHWVQKNQKHYPSICFSQAPRAGIANFLMVLSNSSQSFSGFDPVVHTSTTTDTTPVSGSGTVTDNYGGTWNYTYDGTVTTTTTTTTHENAPYTLNSNSLYIYTFDEHGSLVSRRWKTLTTKQGGDPYNTLGYNLGAALGAINFKSGLLKSAVRDVCGSKKCD
jgi:hypothetical protein